MSGYTVGAPQDADCNAVDVNMPKRDRCHHTGRGRVTTVIIFAAEPMARFLIDDPEVIRLTVVFIHVLGSVQVLMAIEYSLGGALRGAGDTRFPFLTVLIGLFAHVRERPEIDRYYQHSKYRAEYDPR